MRFAILLAAFALAFGGPAAAVECPHDRQGLLALPFQSFDQDPEGGWRPLADREDCLEVAADLLAAYRAAHAELSDDQASLLRWHEAQVRAMAGETDQALALFATTHKPGGNAYARAWNRYVDATIAFLRRDRAALERARAELSAAPKPDGWDQNVARAREERGENFARSFVWPMNLDVVDGLIACFDQPYAEAYGSACRPPQP